MMKRIIFYFSATGNSLYVANSLARCPSPKGGDGNKGEGCPEGGECEALSIPQLMKDGKFDFEAEEIGFVYPIYMHIPPYMVQQFIQKAHLKADYFFAVPTYGARAPKVSEIWQGIAEKAGYHFDYIRPVKMVDNWLHHFNMDDQKAMDKHIPEQLAQVKADLAGRRHYIEPVSEADRELHDTAYVQSGLYRTHGFRFHSENHFVVTDACIRCGICTKVCPRGNWRLGEKKAETSGECDYCLSCIHNCPRKAIQFADLHDSFLVPEANPNSRYRNPKVSLKEIIAANNQH